MQAEWARTLYQDALGSEGLTQACSIVFMIKAFRQFIFIERENNGSEARTEPLQGKCRMGYIEETIEETIKKTIKKTVEETTELQLDFKKIANMSGQEVIPVAIQNADTSEVILVAYTNEQAMIESVRLRRLVLWSTSRNELWYKGKTSGNEFELVDIFVNCEQNSLVYKVRPMNGNICHTSYKGVANNCFYRRLDMDSMKLINLNEERV